MHSNGNSFGVLGECQTGIGAGAGIPISIVAQVTNPVAGRR